MKTYTIHKGKHSSKPRILKAWLNRNTFEFEFILSHNCWYPEGSIEHDGINKVCGVSFGIHAEKPFGKIPLVKNLVNSIIVGWRPNYECKNLFRVNIINDNRGVETRPLWIDGVIAEKKNKVTITRVKKGVNIKINGLSKFFPMNSLPFGYILGFYHGGKSPAPQDMSAKISLQTLKTTS
jgi:hypothetical protein